MSKKKSNRPKFRKGYEAAIDFKDLLTWVYNDGDTCHKCMDYEGHEFITYNFKQTKIKTKQFIACKKCGIRWEGIAYIDKTKAI